MRAGRPIAGAGQRVGLLGGSFDPPHGGHVHVTRTALARFGLDAVWWLVSPGNPLKAHGPAPIARRVEASRALLHDPRVRITDIEEGLGTRYTAETLDRLVALYPAVRFTWLMGADNLAGFHRWQDWRKIAETVPIGVVARPGQSLAALGAPAARALRRHRLPAPGSRLLGGMKPPVWCFVTARLDATSSTELRRRGAWPAAHDPE